MEEDQPKTDQQRSWQHSYQTVPPLYGAPQPSKSTPSYNDELEHKHRESAALYPNLGLSHDEYVITEVKRHPIGLLAIWAVVGIIVIATFTLLPLYSVNLSLIANTLVVSEQALPSPALLGLPLLVVSGLFIVGGIVATYVYNSNRFYLTNESVIQRIQTSLFNKKEQHINLANIEDASYKQHGILQHLLGYGSLRLSTEGDETTYRFHYVTNPQHVVHQVTEGIENATGNAARFRDNPKSPIEIGKH